MEDLLHLCIWNFTKELTIHIKCNYHINLFFRIQQGKIRKKEKRKTVRQQYIIVNNNILTMVDFVVNDHFSRA